MSRQGQLRRLSNIFTFGIPLINLDLFYLVTEANHGDSVYWNIQLDQDLLNTIVSIYPEWFKGLKESNDSTMAQGGGSSAGASATSVGGSSSQTVLFPRSPPKAEVDESPLQKSMDRNKECKYEEICCCFFFLLAN